MNKVNCTDMNKFICTIVDSGKNTKKIMTSKLKHFGITCRQAVVLKIIYSFGAVNSSEIIKNTNFDKATLSTMLKKLVENGFVTKEQGNSDKRLLNFKLSKKGLLVIPEIFAIEKDFINEVSKYFNENELNNLYHLLTRLFTCTNKL